MDPAIMGVLIIACCFAAGVFTSEKRSEKHLSDACSKSHPTSPRTHKEAPDDHA